MLTVTHLEVYCYHTWMFTVTPLGDWEVEFKETIIKSVGL